jgi:hypothetical protein
MRRTVRIVYRGDPPVLDELTKWRMAEGLIPPGSAAVLRGAEVVRSQVMPGVSFRKIDPEFFGTSRYYQFGPSASSYTQEVLVEDVDKILGSSSGHQFVREDDPMRDWVVPPSGLMLVDDIEGGNVREIFPEFR